MGCQIHLFTCSETVSVLSPPEQGKCLRTSLIMTQLALFSQVILRPRYLDPWKSRYPRRFHLLYTVIARPLGVCARFLHVDLASKPHIVVLRSVVSRTLRHRQDVHIHRDEVEDQSPLHDAFKASERQSTSEAGPSVGLDGRRSSRYPVRFAVFDEM